MIFSDGLQTQSVIGWEEIEPGRNTTNTEFESFVKEQIRQTNAKHLELSDRIEDCEEFTTRLLLMTQCNLLLSMAKHLEIQIGVYRKKEREIIGET